MNVPFFPLLPIHLWKNFKMSEFSGKWWSCFPLSWGSGWETSGLFFVWFPGVTVTDTCAQVGCCVYPAWVTILLFRQVHKVLGRLSAAPGPRGRCSPPSSPVSIVSGGGRNGDSGGEGWRSSPGCQDRSLPSEEGIQALPGWHWCSSPSRACPALLSPSAWVCISAECGDCHTKGSPSPLQAPGTAGDFGKS